MLGRFRGKNRKKSCSDIRKRRGFTRMRDAEREEGIFSLIKM